eukprot:CAMPEP_0113846106 /NCGR_PEP_ID=MMETSP0372-20130328/1124_1 /TAXON_ID=340204 /ORGANISM="Lankesteria abbotti" /LENGTH=311 /DNA_ID=CAMNT_0000815215 /DNA_START=48 /DNA_END=979 /DNA_ORIENTATION=+ /assembly_acc=CAM_ASM_000359
MGAAPPIAPRASAVQFDCLEENRSLVRCTNLSSYSMSSSFLYCMVQHAAEWPDYYVVLDLRNRVAFEKAHIRESLWIGKIPEDAVADHLQGMIVAMVDQRPDSPTCKKFMQVLASEAICPASVYVLNETFEEFRRKYYFVLSNFQPTVGQLPGPIEYVPRTKHSPAIYGLQRDRYPNCKTLVAYLGCTKVLNLSSTRLSVKQKAVTLENVCFTDVSEPLEESVAVLFSFAKPTLANSWRGHIMIIDEPGSHYSALVTGWYLVESCGFNVDAVAQHMSNKSADLDPWYMNTLQHWAGSRRIERMGIAAATTP